MSEKENKASSAGSTTCYMHNLPDLKHRLVQIPFEGSKEVKSKMWAILDEFLMDGWFEYKTTYKNGCIEYYLYSVVHST